jgi:predicted TIM-barrel fold metal-dependent hydrolase
VADPENPSRRRTVFGIGALGAAAFAGAAPASTAGVPSPAGKPSRSARVSAREARAVIRRRVEATPLADTHAHTLEEATRLSGTSSPRIPCDDWSFVLGHYLDADLLCAGMPPADHERFFAAPGDPLEKWRLIEPWWPHVRHTGYGRAVAITLRELYGVEALSAATVARVQDGYEALRAPGFYETALRTHARLHSTQVNSLEDTPFMRSAHPTLLLQDIGINQMFDGPDIRRYAAEPGATVSDLADWHRVMDWWFTRYGPYAVAAKSSHAYARNIDYADVPADAVQDAFRRRLSGERLPPAEKKALEDHIFWHAVRGATRAGLPVKLHTGYYAQWRGKGNRMPLGRVGQNPAAACDLCVMAPETRWVFMHIGYPYYEDFIAVGKQNPNAWVDLCWAWIVNPVASKDFLKKWLVSAPSNKVLVFGADYTPVEPVVGHAVIAREGITAALAELVDEGWMSLDDAVDLVEPLMHGNARALFDVDAKQKTLESAPWRAAPATRG